MPDINIRTERFLTNYDFFMNSIEFRICSSKALEQWKNVQSFQLNQLVNGKFYFDLHLKEILLVKYDLWSKFLYEIENFCIEHSGKRQNDVIEQRDIEFTQKLVHTLISKFGSIVSDNPQAFNPEFMNIYNKTRVAPRKYMLTKISTLVNCSTKKYFKEIVNLVIDLMQHELTCILELGIIFDEYNNEEQFKCALIINEFNDKTYDLIGECLIVERLNIYKDKFNISEIYIKNYTHTPISCSISNKIEQLGVKIDYKLSSRFETLK